MKTLDAPARRCPYPECPSNSRGLRPHVIAHSRLKTKNGWRRRRLCRVCGRTFTATTGTVYHRLRRSKRDFDLAVKMQAEGMTKAAVSRSVTASPSTVSRWLERAARHAREFSDAFLRLPEHDGPAEFQLDELGCRGVGEARNAWVFNAVEVWSRIWASLRVGNRTRRNTLLFVRRLKAVVGSRWRPFLITSDEFKYYDQVMGRVFRHSPCVYVQVHNRYGARGIVNSSFKRVMGTSEALESLLAKSEDSKRPNTAYVERTNLRSRMSCATLRRRNPAPARKPAKVEEALELVRVIYNFVRGHSSLKFGGRCRTPAMQAGIFSRPLRLREIFNWAVPVPERRRQHQARLVMGER